MYRLSIGKEVGVQYLNKVTCRAGIRSTDSSRDQGWSSTA